MAAHAAQCMLRVLWWGEWSGLSHAHTAPLLPASLVLCWHVLPPALLPFSASILHARRQGSAAHGLHALPSTSGWEGGGGTQAATLRPHLPTLKLQGLPSPPHHLIANYVPHSPLPLHGAAQSHVAEALPGATVPIGGGVPGARWQACMWAIGRGQWLC